MVRAKRTLYGAEEARHHCQKQSNQIIKKMRMVRLSTILSGPWHPRRRLLPARARRMPVHV